MGFQVREVAVALVLFLVGGCMLARARADVFAWPAGDTASGSTSSPLTLEVDDAGFLVLGRAIPVILGSPTNFCGGPVEGFTCVSGYHGVCRTDAGTLCEKNRDPCDTLTPVKADGGRLRRYYRLNDAGIMSEDVPVERRCPPGTYDQGSGSWQVNPLFVPGSNTIPTSDVPGINLNVGGQQ